jgi:hypothetical protein
LFVLDCKPHRSLKPRRNEPVTPRFTIIVLVILGSSLIANCYTQTCFDKLRQIGIQGMMWETSKSQSLSPAHAWSKQFQGFWSSNCIFAKGFIKSPTRNSKQASGYFLFYLVVLLHQWCFLDYFIWRHFFWGICN